MTIISWHQVLLYCKLANITRSFPLTNSSTHTVIKELGLIFTELGRPFILRSDNGPCYSSRELHNFLSFYQIDHVTSSPHYPQSNGFAEALVGIAKKLMDKSVKDGKPWNYGLMQYRTTLISLTLPSPLEMLTVRRPCSILPQLTSTIGKNVETSKIHEVLLRRQPNTYRDTYGIGPWTTCLCQGSEWKCFGKLPLLTNQQLS